MKPIGDYLQIRTVSMDCVGGFIVFLQIGKELRYHITQASIDHPSHTPFL
jgi:hypothetical protein